MQDHKSFFDLDNEGFIHYVHSDPYHINILYEDCEDDTLYRLCLNKDYYINSVNEVQTPVPVSEIDFIKWNRPDKNNFDDIVFNGCMSYEDQDVRFTIDSDKLTVKQPVKINDSFSFPDIPALEDKEVTLHAQKGNYLFAIVWDSDLGAYGCYVFYEIRLADNAVLRRYILDSGDGEIIIHSLNIDHWSNRIYIAGVKEVNSHSYKEVKFKPYLETLIYTQIKS